MNDFVKQILDWPILIQAVLGSFLFWIIFKSSEIIINYATARLKAENELGSSFGKLAKDAYEKNKDFHTSNFNFFICLYGSLHYFLKFVIIIFISFILRDFVPVFAYVGYIIAFYFIFRSISYVTHFANFLTEEEKVEEKRLVKEAREAKKKK